MSFLINCGLIGLVWWSADKLTWDCTLIDESEEDSGEGLLEAVGLDRPAKAACKRRGRSGDSPGFAGSAGGTTFADAKIGQSPEPSRLRKDWWRRFVDAAAALTPLEFGSSISRWPRWRCSASASSSSPPTICPRGSMRSDCSGLHGQRAGSAADDELSGLAPLSAAATAGNAACDGQPLVGPRRRDDCRRDAGDDALAAAQPRIRHLGTAVPHRLARSRKSSPYGTGRDGVKEQRPWSHGVRNDQQQSDRIAQDRRHRNREKARPQPAGEGNLADAKQERLARQRSPLTGSKSGTDNAGQAAIRQRHEKLPAAQPPVDNRQWFHDSGPLLATLIKWLVYGVLALVAVRSIWSHRSQFLAALGNFGQWLSNFWHRLFGAMANRAASATDEATSMGTPRRRFADFSNPFATGQATGWPPEELVRYSFAALEAWAAEHGHPRQAEQTPHEFARSIASNFSLLADDALRLADLYCQVAYAPGTLPAMSTTCLSRLWRDLASPIEHMASGPPSVR